VSDIRRNMSAANPKSWNLMFAGGPLIPTFAKVTAATGREC
jgi:hypothetical protein